MTDGRDRALRPTLPERLRRGDAVVGCMVTAPSTEVTRTLAISGCDFLIFDAEHSAIGQHSLIDLVMATAGTDCYPVVRVPGGDAALAKPALDVGVLGLALPHVSTAEDARALVACAKYPPVGERGVGPAHAMRRWNMTLSEYVAFTKDNVLTLAIVESASAGPALGEILKVPGLDVVLVAREDLAASMGHIGNAGHPDVVRMAETLEDEVLTAGLTLGCRARSEDDLEVLKARGFRFIIVGSDLQLLATAVRSRTRNQSADRVGGT